MYLLFLKNYTDPVILRKGTEELSKVNTKSSHVRLTAKYDALSMVLGLPIPPSLSDSNFRGYQGRDIHRQNHLRAVRIIGHD